MDGIRFRSMLPMMLLSLQLLLVVSADDATTSFHVSGYGECADCAHNNFKNSDAFPGLLVSIDCKVADSGEMQRVASGELNEKGSFLVDLPKEVVDQKTKKLKKDCFAQLHSAAATPCPMHEGIEAAKIDLKSTEDGKLIFSPAKKLKFSTSVCTSKFLWPIYGFPPLPKLPWKKEEGFHKKPLLNFWFHHKHEHFAKTPIVKKKPEIVVPPKKPEHIIPPVVKKKPVHVIPPVVKKKPEIVVPPVVKKPEHVIPPVVKKKPEIVVPPVKEKPFPFFHHPFFHKKPFPHFFKKPFPFFKPPFEKPFPPVIPHA